MSNAFYELFNLRNDQEQPHLIDQTIRGNVKVVGTNLWVLFFAILIASVGLNVNSTAVIIGAMLISPLMGPIVGIGYGVGINDVSLIKLSIRNLAIFTFISLIASTLYFTISPLDTAQSELLARTSPNLWDVLIAFFGGAAGIIAVTRKNMSNVVPGVAIATALMPPLCTAGFGIAHGNWTFFGGAFFLYSINSVFIAFATLVFVKIFKLPHHKELDEITQKRTYALVGLTVLLMIVPSVYLAYNLVQQNSFNQTANRLLESTYRDPNYVVLGHDINGQSQEIFLTVGGEHPPQDLAKNIETQLVRNGFEKAHVIVRYSGNEQVDLSSLKTELQQDLYNNMVKQIDDLNDKNTQLNTQLQKVANNKLADTQLFAELKAQYAPIQSVSISRGHRYIYQPAQTNKAGETEVNTTATTLDTISSPASQADLSAQLTQQNIAQITLVSSDALSEADKQRIHKWLSIRFEDMHVEVVFLTTLAPNAATVLQTEEVTPADETKAQPVT